MAAQAVTDEQLGRLARKQHELFRRVREGSLSLDFALAGLQLLLDGKTKASEGDLSGWRIYEGVLGIVREAKGEAISFSMISKMMEESTGCKIEYPLLYGAVKLGVEQRYIDDLSDGLYKLHYSAGTRLGAALRPEEVTWDFLRRKADRRGLPSFF